MTSGAASPTVGIDVGGTAIKAAVIASDGAIGARARRPTPDRGGDGTAVIDAVHGLVDELRASSPEPPSAVGLAVPGIIDEAAGVARYAAAFGWRDAPIRDLVARATGLPVALGHDVRAAGRAEWAYGAAAGTGDALVVTLGTGIGAAVVVDGRMLVADGYAGQLGHLVVDPRGPDCRCGQRGCLSTQASADAVARRYAERTGREAGASEVARLVGCGDADAVAVWDEAIDALVRGLIVAVTTYGSEIVVLGGGLVLAGDQLIVPVRDRLDERLTFQRHPEVRTAALGDEAGCVGAGILGRTVAIPR